MFWEKAIVGWINRGDLGRVGLVSDYIMSVSYVDSSGRSTPGFRVPPTVVSSERGASPGANPFQRLWGALLRAAPTAQDPFFAVIGYKELPSTT